MKENSEHEKLKLFILKNIPFRDLKKAGFFGKDVQKNDYEAIASRICQFFGYKSVYEYGNEEVGCHLSMDRGKAGNEPFITVAFAEERIAHQKKCDDLLNEWKDLID